MAQNVTIAGASYSDVPAVDIPKTGGGSARFVDSSDANASAADILSGKTAYVNGEKLTGTGSGGGLEYKSTSAELDATLASAYVGHIYKYTGTDTSLYKNGRLYLVEDTATGLDFNGAVNEGGIQDTLGTRTSISSESHGEIQGANV